MCAKRVKGHRFFGSTTVGAKGQVVVPASARRALGVDTGDKLLVFGMGDDVLVLATVGHMEKMAVRLSKKLSAITDVIRKNG